MQRIFKAYDEKDVKELFKLLPDYVIKLRCERETANADMRDSKGEYRGVAHCLNIKWGDLREIKRPDDYRKYIGKLGFFWNNNWGAGEFVVSTLSMVNIKGKFFADVGSGSWEFVAEFDNFRPLTLEELKEKSLIAEE